MNARDRLERARALVEYLCSKECGGRRTGTAESSRARRRIAEDLATSGAKPAGTHGFEQPISIAGGANILAEIPGQGPNADRAIVIAAHYDHLGWSFDDEAYWGADDNAAAVAILVDVARTLASVASVAPLGRKIIFAAFDAEEPPHFLSGQMGSQFYVEHPLIPLDSIDLMICMDLMGHALGDERTPEPIRRSFFVLGAETSAGTAEIVERVSSHPHGVRPLRFAGDVIPPLSDYYAFAEARVPYLFLSCGRWQHYHQITDTPEKLDYAKMISTADWLADLVIELAARPERSVFSTARDDRSSLESLRTVVREMAALRPEVAQVLAEIDRLEACLDARGALPENEQLAVTILAAMMEESLA